MIQPVILLSDRRGDPFTYKSNNPFNFSDTAYIKRDIQYDPKTKQYYIVEKIGNSYYRTPTYLTFDEMMRFKAKQSGKQIILEKEQIP
jgi:hypothetical protein